MIQGWWLDQLPDDLDQGDIFADVPFLDTVFPVQPLKLTSMKNAEPGWMKLKGAMPRTPQVPMLANGRTGFAMLMNHGCDLDKPRNKRCTLVSVSSLEEYPEGQRDEIAAQTSVPLLYLPAVPGQDDMVADFRVTTSVPRTFVNETVRLASMTEAARDRMRAQLIEFYVMRRLPGQPSL